MLAKVQNRKVNAKSKVTKTLAKTKAKAVAKPKTKPIKVSPKEVILKQKSVKKPQPAKTRAISGKIKKAVDKGAKMNTATIKRPATKPEPTKEIPRKRLQRPGVSVGSSKLRELQEASFNAYRAREIAKERAAKGLPPSLVAVVTPEQLVIALQVRDDSNPEWSILRSIPINSHTSESQLRKYRQELNDLKMGWVVSNYFGSNAEFRICRLTQKGHQAVY